MKKSLLKAFTLVELIIVISIMTLVTTGSVFYFIDFIDNKEVSQKIKTIEDDLLELDKNIKEYKIFDYELIFNTNSLSGGYITYLNNFDIDYTQNITLNTSNGSGIINIGGAVNTLTGTIKLYKKHKLYLNQEIQYGTNIDFDFNTEPYYKIKSTLSGEILNEIHINYFSEDNIYPERNNFVNLIKIEKEDLSTIDKLIITNIGGNKIFYKNSISSANEIINDKIKLYFENNGIEKFIQITK